jgi:uncharacterized protein
VAGDLVYFVIQTDDPERAKEFYGSLFGWDFTEGNVPEGFNIEGTTPPGGVFGGGKGWCPSVYFSVDDIDAALAKVRELGGEASEPEAIATGHMAHCRDDQGREFNLWAPREGSGG